MKVDDKLELVTVFKNIQDDLMMLWHQLKPEGFLGVVKFHIGKYLNLESMYKLDLRKESGLEKMFSSVSEPEDLLEGIVLNIKEHQEDSGCFVLSKNGVEPTENFYDQSLPFDVNLRYCYYLGLSSKEYLISIGKFKSKQDALILEFLSGQYQIYLKQQEKLDSSRSLLYVDEVTGVYNTRYLDLVLSNEIKRASRFKEEFSLLFLDLDEFKKVNDVYGHLTGSSVLVQVSQVLKSSLRQIDSIVRYGGDEFVVLLLNTNIDQATITAERIRSKIDQTVFYTKDKGKKIHLTVSIGIASYPQVSTKDQLLKIADEAMYISKKNGKNKVMVWTDLEQISFNPQVSESLQIQKDVLD